MPNASPHLSRQDFIFAAAMHLGVVVIVAIIMWWSPAKELPKLPSIQVQSVSLQELQQMQRATQTQTPQKKPIKKAAPRPPEPKKIAAKTPPKSEKKPIPKPATPKPAPKPTKTVEKVVQDKDFDPFAPMVSTSNTPVAKKKTSQASPVKAETNTPVVPETPLSQREIDHYIAMMQRAVQEHWNVPVGIAANTKDPLVEMLLLQDGSVKSVRILESSGQTVLDQTLIKAIHAASPFTLPPERYGQFLHNRIRFHPL